MNGYQGLDIESTIDLLLAEKPLADFRKTIRPGSGEMNRRIKLLVAQLHFGFHDLRHDNHANRCEAKPCKQLGLARALEVLVRARRGPLDNARRDLAEVLRAVIKKLNLAATKFESMVEKNRAKMSTIDPRTRAHADRQHVPLSQAPLAEPPSGRGQEYEDDRLRNPSWRRAESRDFVRSLFVLVEDLDERLLALSVTPRERLALDVTRCLRGSGYTAREIACLVDCGELNLNIDARINKVRGWFEEINRIDRESRAPGCSGAKSRGSVPPLPSPPAASSGVHESSRPMQVRGGRSPRKCEPETSSRKKAPNERTRADPRPPSTKSPTSRSQRSPRSSSSKKSPKKRGRP